jgi:formamidopyrimidine-DNA glycosylase
VPELPEVETLHRGLTATVLGARITSVDLLWRPAVAAPDGTVDLLTGGGWTRCGAVARH